MKKIVVKEDVRFPIFSQRFNKLRGEITQACFADFLDISRPTIGFYENGERLPDALTLRKIAERCGVAADWLLGLSDYQKQGIPEIASIAKATQEGAIKFYIEGQMLYIQSAITGERAAIGTEKRTFDGGDKPAL